MTRLTKREKEIVAAIRAGNIDDLEFSEVCDVMKDPGAYHLTFGEVVRICRICSELVRFINHSLEQDAIDRQKKVNTELRKKNKDLELRVACLEMRLDQMSEKGE